MMKIGYNIPLDLLIEILLRLPAKSVLRFRFVSKSWRSIISSQHFIDSFMSLSLSRPRLLLAFDDDDNDRVLFFSAPYQSSSFLTSSSVLVAETNALMMPKNKSNYDYYICNSVRGFLCCCIEEDDEFVVCNPTTGQVFHLSEKKDYINYYSMYLGYDPKSDQYKVLRINSLRSSGSSTDVEHSVCTLRGQVSSHSWRPIKTNILYDYCYQNGECIDGVVYYQYDNHGKTGLSSFDVGSEQFRLISTPTDLSGIITNYLGKLALFDSLEEHEGQFRMWVLDDVENQVWSNKTLVIPPELLCSGITIYGDFVNAPVELPFSDSCELPCYDVEKRIDRRVRLEGLENIRGFCSYLTCIYVENIIYL